MAALQKYNPDALNPRVFNIIPKFLGGTLCLILINSDLAQFGF